MGVGAKWGRTLGAVAAALPVSVLVRDCVADVVGCVGVSMQPTINPYPDPETLRKYYFSRYWRDVALVNKVATRSGKYERGSVVMLRAADDPNKLLMKRLVGLEGDWVINRNGDYVHVAKGHCWVEGDNEEHSIDSNDFGAVPLALIEGRCTHVVWPPWRIQRVPARSAGERHKGMPRVSSRPFQYESIGMEQVVGDQDGQEFGENRQEGHFELDDNEEEGLFASDKEIELVGNEARVEHAGTILDGQDVLALPRSDPQEGTSSFQDQVERAADDAPNPAQPALGESRDHALPQASPKVFEGRSGHEPHASDA